MSNYMTMNSGLLQTQAPFFEEVLRYSNHPFVAFHTPGHKSGRGWEKDWRQPELLAKLDLTEISALDWANSLKQAESLAARFYQADRSFFLVQGASQGIHGVILGAFDPGDIVLVARNCHCSVINAIILADLNPVYLEIDFLQGWEIPVGVNAESLIGKLNEYPECKGLIVTNPTYQGIAEQVNFYRENIGDRILIIDEAHGGHLGWSGLNGVDAFRVADAWVQGTHKMLGSLTQTGILHLRQSRIDLDRVKRCLELITTTSPSYILMASLDSNRRFLAVSGSKLFRQKLAMVDNVKSQLAKVDSIAVLNNELLNDPRKTVDPWKISISFNTIGMNGYEAERLLQTEFGIQPENVDFNQITCFITPWQDENELKYFQQAVYKLSVRPGKNQAATFFPSVIPPLMMRPREAVFGPSQIVDLKQAIGRVSASIISPYPPGVPLIGPGELVRDMEVNYIEEVLQYGGVIHGLSPDGKIRITTVGE